jgi:hypothetical protein
MPKDISKVRMTQKNGVIHVPFFSVVAVASALALAARSLGAQVPASNAQPPSFEVASVKRNTSGSLLVNEQLGLKLEAKTDKVEMLIIDRLERPTEN